MNFYNFLVLLLIQLQAGLNDGKGDKLEEEGVAVDLPQIKILSTLEQASVPSHLDSSEVFQESNRNMTGTGGFRPSEPDIYRGNFQTPNVVVEQSELTKDFDKNTGNVEMFQNTIKSEAISNSNRFQFTKKVQYPPQYQISRKKSAEGRNLFNSLTNSLTRVRPDYQERQTQDFPATTVDLKLTPDRADYGKGQKKNIFLNSP